MAVKITEQPFGEFDGKQVNKYLITQLAGIQVSVMNYGATVTGIIVPDKVGSPADVVLGFDTLTGYINAGDTYMGSICGRYANRVANARFSINGNEYHLTENDGKNCLHGGLRGFDKVIWDTEFTTDGDGIKFNYTSKDGEEGFPGNLAVSVAYRVADNALYIEYTAVTDKATPVNLTSHCYFNLSGGKEENILDHELQINADQFLEVCEDLLPTGKIPDVNGTAMDFTSLHKTGSMIGRTGGYDHCWVIRRNNGELSKAATLIHRESGREMTVYTTQPGLHFYSGHLLNGNFIQVKKGKEYKKYAGLCLEAQHFPDSPNHNDFPDTILKPGETYYQKTIYSFENIRL